MPYVGIGVTTLCKQVPNGRDTNSNSAARPPILWKKPVSIDGEKPHCVLMKNHSDEWQARVIGEAEKNSGGCGSTAVDI